MVQQELGLLAFLDLGGTEVRRSNGGPVDLVKVVETRAELGVVGSSVRKRECPTTVIGIRPGDDPTKICLKMHNWSLPASVGELELVLKYTQP